MTDTGGWSKATREAPCLVCGGDDRCARSDNGEALWCWRSDDPPPGWRKSKSPAKKGCSFVLEHKGHPRSDLATSSTPHRDGRRDEVPADHHQLTASLALECSDDRVHALAQDLGVAPDVLRDLRVGWADREALQDLHVEWSDPSHGDIGGAYSFPEVDDVGRVSCISLQTPDGCTGLIEGATRGLIETSELDIMAGPVLVLEGISSVAATLTLGIAAIGRPSNRGGTSQLAQRLRDREMLIIGERDEDLARPDRGWPGRDGAVHVAGALARVWREPVRWTLPPQGAKDIRAWLGDRIADGLDLADPTACHMAGDELLAMLVASCELEDPPLKVQVVRESYGRHIATLAIAAKDDDIDGSAVIHSGRLRIADTGDRRAWTTEAASIAKARTPWLGGGDTSEAERIIGDLLDAAVREEVAKITVASTVTEEEHAAVAERLVRLAEKTFRLGVSEEGEPFAVVRDGANIAISLRGSADALRGRLARDFRREYGTTPSGSALSDALTVLAGEAQDCAPERVALRVALDGGRVVLDLGDPEGRAIEIDATGWWVVERSPVLFRRTALTGQLPVPERGASIDALRDHIAVAPADWPHLVGWLVHALIPAEPHSILLLGGAQGAGKTTAAERLVMLIDPSGAPTRTAPPQPWQFSASW